MNTSRKCVYLASGGFPKSPPGLCPWIPLGISVTQIPCAHPTSKPWLRHCSWLVSGRWQVISERDILGTQLVRRNDEVALLYEKIKIQQSTLHKGEAQYNGRLEDIRVLKLEIRKLRRERLLLQKSVANVDDLKLEF